MERIYVPARICLENLVEHDKLKKREKGCEVNI